MTLDACRLYGIVDLGYVKPGEVVAMTRVLAGAGVDVIQLRAKGWGETEIRGWVRAMREVTRGEGVPLIVNDHPEIALQEGADGVHVGQDDLGVEAVRRIVGPDLIVGKSTHSLEQARAAAGEAGVDYLGFGPLFPTPTKPEYGAIGLEEIAAVHREVALPVFCIGGVKRENLDKVLQAGARRVVIVSGLLLAPDPAACVREVKAMLG